MCPTKLLRKMLFCELHTRNKVNYQCVVESSAGRRQMRVDKEEDVSYQKSFRSALEYKCRAELQLTSKVLIWRLKMLINVE